MRTITNVFLLSLAVSDILLGVLCMPVTLLGTLLRHFIFGEFFCKLIQFSQAVSVAVSSWTLVAISCERYYAICHPLRSRRWQTRSHAYKIIACIWCGSMACMLPIAMFSQLIPTNRQGLRKCREKWPIRWRSYERTYNLFLDLILLVLPLIILSVAYILITRTLFVGMRIEKAMIFDDNQDPVDWPLRREYQRSTRLRKSSCLSNSSLSTSVSSSSRLKLNNSLNYGGRPTNSSPYNKKSRVDTPNHQAPSDNKVKETETLRHQQQHQHNLQLSAQRLHQQHNFQNYHEQHQIILQEEKEQPQYGHQLSCEHFTRFCLKTSNGASTSVNSGRPHLYCMRFATLKTALTTKEGNSISHSCKTDCSSGDSAATTPAINVSSTSPTVTPQRLALPTPPITLASTSAPAIYRYHNRQHNHQSCFCMVQQMVPQFNNKVNSKKPLGDKKSLKATESVLRRNNIAKNLESKKRVVKMLFVLVLEFFVCWAPLYVVNTLAMYIGSAIYEHIDYTTVSVLQLLAYSSSCCNPITYCFMNANFRRAFCDTFKGLQWWRKRFKRRRAAAAQSGEHFYLAGSVRVNSCTVQTVIDSPRL